MVFALTFDDIERMFSDQKGCCAISGLSFAPTRLPNAFVKHPFAPSLDRIDCTGGYTPGNVRLVCIAVNFGLGQWGEEVFRSIAEATVRNQLRRERCRRPNSTSASVRLKPSFRC